MVAARHDGGGGGGTTATTPAFTMNGLISAITGVPEVVLDAGTVAQLQEKLIEARDALVEAQAQMRAMGASSVGGSPVGAALVHHSGLADTHLRDLIDAINLGLDRYDSALTVSLTQIEGADEQAAAAAAVGSSAISEATGPGVSG